jgi:hypothetical protein
MAAGTNLIPFPDPVRARSSSAESTGTPFEAGKKKGPEFTTFVQDLAFRTTLPGGQGGTTGPRLTQEELYPARQAFSLAHLTALRLLKLAVGRSQRALSAAANGEIVEADTEIQKLQVLLPELFCCRILGDGFGTVVNATICAFEFLSGDTPSIEQIRTFNRVFQFLREKPFLGTDEADSQVELLEAAQLNPYPAELTDFLSSDESLR